MIKMFSKLLTTNRPTIFFLAYCTLCLCGENKKGKKTI